MQPAPARLQRAIWSAFKAAKPASSSLRHHPGWQAQHLQQSWRTRCNSPSSRLQLSQIRFYSDEKKIDIEEKVQDARQRINDTIEARADAVINLPGPDEESVKRPQDETIIHTVPESSSIVYNQDAPGETAARAAAATVDQTDTTARATVKDQSRPKSDAHSSDETSSSTSTSSSNPLPSQIAARYSLFRERLSDFMDNFQVHVFTASKRLNDLTGYSSIEQLKREIEAQERAVRRARQHVKDSRSAYQTAVTTRADTQREVNDLLHRKHAWSPQDLERFTNLYRSDHANEQSEQKAHTDLAQAEAAYEDASSRLSKSILARYHEEQVWSDKIRQMSTWGTWGLMGLNVLLFVVFQILVEPWRRRRLVRGFEEKVQEALKEQSAEQELRTLLHIERAREGDTPLAAAAVVEEVVAGSTLLDQTTTTEASFATGVDATPPINDPPIEEMAQRTNIEQAIEAATTAEVLSEVTADQSLASDTASASATLESAATETHDPSETSPGIEADPLPPLSTAEYKDIPFLLGSYTRKYLEKSTAKIQSLFDESQAVTLSQRDLTARVLEGAFVGAVGVVCLFWAVGISSVRGR